MEGGGEEVGFDMGRGLSGSWKETPPGCSPHTDAGAVDGVLDLAGAGRVEPWDRPGQSGRLEAWGVSVTR